MSDSEIPEIFNPPGSCLYHYTRLGTALELILPTWRMRMSPFSEMRDPRESKRWGFEAPVTNLDARDEIARFAELTRLADELKGRVKVLALTRDDPGERDERSAVFGRGFAHPRLWEHYADNHRGLCLCFDKKTLTQMLTKEFATRGVVEHGPVRYVDAEIAPEARRFLLEKNHKRPAIEALHAHVAEHLAELFFTKLRDWETEVEYRFVVRTGDTQPVFVNVSNSLRALIIGEAVSTHYIPALSALCDPKTVVIYRIQWEQGRPRLLDPRALGYS